MVLLHWLKAVAQQGEEREETTGRMAARVLARIDAEHFGNLEQELPLGEEQQFAKVYGLMSRFLSLREFKRLSCHYQKQVLKERKEEQLLSLLLYLAVNSDFKQEAVESILEFAQQEQRQLMRAIQEVEANCEQIMQFRQIVEKIESIEQDNESLRARIAAAEEEFEQRFALVQEMEAANAAVAESIAEYEEEKEGVLKALHIHRMEEFTEICLLNKQQNGEISRSLQELEEERSQQSKQNCQLRKELKRHGETIQRQIKEIDELKARCAGIDQEEWEGEEAAAIPDIPVLPLRDNKNILNTDPRPPAEKPKLPTDRTQCSTHSEALEESFEVKNNLHVLLSLNQLQRLQGEGVQELQRLKAVREGELRRGRRLGRKMGRLMECHREFVCAQLIKQ